MKLKDFGERALLKLAKDICSKGPPIEIGLGDDAAAIDMGEECLVATTDMLIERIHFPPGTPVEQIGRKAVVVNLSDLAAMGAEPLALLFSIGVPKNAEVDFMEGLVRTMNATARKYGAYLVGGDLNESDNLVVSGMALGRATKNQLLLRSGAKAGNFVAVTGELGKASAGTKILLEKISEKGNDELMKAFTEPVARVNVGRILSKSGGVTSAIDLTDGLARSLWQLSQMSKVKILIGWDKLPISSRVREFVRRHELDLDDFVLYGGEEFELLFTVEEDKWGRIKREIQDEGVRATKIGEVVDGNGVYLERGGKIEEMPDRGYEHFR